MNERREREPGANGARGAGDAVSLRRFPVELRASTNDDAPAGTLEGYASVFDVEYRIGWGIKESIQRGAFEKSLSSAGGIIPIFLMHDWDNPIGHAVALEDAHGVHVTATLYIDANERAMAVWLGAKAGAFRFWSIGFYPTVIELSTNDDGSDLETIVEGDLAEASVVVRGANPATEMLDVRSKPEGDDAPPAGDALDDETVNLLAEHADRSWCRDALREIHKSV